LSLTLPGKRKAYHNSVILLHLRIATIAELKKMRGSLATAWLQLCWHPFAAVRGSELRVNVHDSDTAAMFGEFQGLP
jgi:hypothetical protein